MGSMVTVSLAELLPGVGSPSAVFVTVAVLVKLPSLMARFTVMGTVTVSPWASTPPVWVQVTVAVAMLQLKVAVLPPETVAVTALIVVRPLMKAGTVSVMRTPVAFCGVAEAFVTTRV